MTFLSYSLSSDLSTVEVWLDLLIVKFNLLDIVYGRKFSVNI